MLAKAMILKKQDRMRNRAKAEMLLKEVMQESNNTIIDPQFHLMALTLFCEHLLEKLITFDDSEILNEINPLITQILEISEPSEILTPVYNRIIVAINNLILVIL